ncbi:uncharacterized protein I303_107382 [Kwoniella dejecticola CBS 10117]|uniref:Uncharacterized protein n=1 Tax=Kwoniella dejecticola CBS 10117 TaxID=1296121 RepID=A0A1A5ZZJ1_9TREE|nr:uncharacterized protein I303_06786 [Kwoniella dejecticola CBS 10117]OBR83225.1 hypothetical protein I303_06786 [Kwoniella dejecticola CBS 10117]
MSGSHLPPRPPPNTPVPSITPSSPKPQSKGKGKAKAPVLPGYLLPQGNDSMPTRVSREMHRDLDRDIQGESTSAESDEEAVYISEGDTLPIPPGAENGPDLRTQRTPLSPDPLPVSPLPLPPKQPAIEEVPKQNPNRRRLKELSKQLRAIINRIIEAYHHRHDAVQHAPDRGHHRRKAASKPRSTRSGVQASVEPKSPLVPSHDAETTLRRLAGSHQYQSTVSGSPSHLNTVSDGTEGNLKQIIPASTPEGHEPSRPIDIPFSLEARRRRSRELRELERAQKLLRRGYRGPLPNILVPKLENALWLHDPFPPPNRSGPDAHEEENEDVQLLARRFKSQSPDVVDESSGTEVPKSYTYPVPFHLVSRPRPPKRYRSDNIPFGLPRVINTRHYPPTASNESESIEGLSIGSPFLAALSTFGPFPILETHSPLHAGDTKSSQNHASTAQITETAPSSSKTVEPFSSRAEARHHRDSDPQEPEEYDYPDVFESSSSSDPPSSLISPTNRIQPPQNSHSSSTNSLGSIIDQNLWPILNGHTPSSRTASCPVELDNVSQTSLTPSEIVRAPSLEKFSVQARRSNARQSVRSLPDSQQSQTFLHRGVTHERETLDLNEGRTCHNLFYGRRRVRASSAERLFKGLSRKSRRRYTTLRLCGGSSTDLDFVEELRLLCQSLYLRRHRQKQSQHIGHRSNASRRLPQLSPLSGDRIKFFVRDLKAPHLRHLDLKPSRDAQTLAISLRQKVLNWRTYVLASPQQTFAGELPKWIGQVVTNGTNICHFKPPDHLTPGFMLEERQNWLQGRLMASEQLDETDSAFEPAGVDMNPDGSVDHSLDEGRYTRILKPYPKQVDYITSHANHPRGADPEEADLAACTCDVCFSAGVNSNQTFDMVAAAQHQQESQLNKDILRLRGGSSGRRSDSSSSSSSSSKHFAHTNIPSIPSRAEDVFPLVTPAALPTIFSGQPEPANTSRSHSITAPSPAADPVAIFDVDQSPRPQMHVADMIPRAEWDLVFTIVRIQVQGALGMHRMAPYPTHLPFYVHEAVLRAIEEVSGLFGGSAIPGLQALRQVAFRARWPPQLNTSYDFHPQVSTTRQFTSVTRDLTDLDQLAALSTSIPLPPSPFDPSGLDTADEPDMQLIDKPANWIDTQHDRPNSAPPQLEAAVGSSSYNPPDIAPIFTPLSTQVPTFMPFPSDSSSSQTAGHSFDQSTLTPGLAGQLYTGEGIAQPAAWPASTTHAESKETSSPNFFPSAIPENFGDLWPEALNTSTSPTFHGINVNPTIPIFPEASQSFSPPAVLIDTAHGMPDVSHGAQALSDLPFSSTPSAPSLAWPASTARPMDIVGLLPPSDLSALLPNMTDLSAMGWPPASITSEYHYVPPGAPPPQPAEVQPTYTEESVSAIWPASTSGHEGLLALSGPSRVEIAEGATSVTTSSMRFGSAASIGTDFMVPEYSYGGSGVATTSTTETFGQPPAGYWSPTIPPGLAGPQIPFQPPRPVHHGSTYASGIFLPPQANFTASEIATTSTYRLPASPYTSANLQPETLYQPDLQTWLVDSRLPPSLSIPQLNIIRPTPRTSVGSASTPNTPSGNGSTPGNGNGNGRSLAQAMARSGSLGPIGETSKDARERGRSKSRSGSRNRSRSRNPSVAPEQHRAGGRQLVVPPKDTFGRARRSRSLSAPARPPAVHAHLNPDPRKSREQLWREMQELIGPNTGARRQYREWEIQNAERFKREEEERIEKYKIARMEAETVRMEEWMRQKRLGPDIFKSDPPQREFVTTPGGTPHLVIAGQTALPQLASTPPEWYANSEYLEALGHMPEMRGEGSSSSTSSDISTGPGPDQPKKKRSISDIADMALKELETQGGREGRKRSKSMSGSGGSGESAQVEPTETEAERRRREKGKGRAG